MKSFIKIFILFLLLSQLSQSQINNKSVQVLVRGMVTDQMDNSPLQVEVRFEDPTGKFFKISSNSLTGKYEQILSSNTQYKVRLFADNIFPTEFILTTPEVKAYTEIEQNYQVIKLEPGRTVLVYDLFSEGKTDLNSDITQFLDELNIKMRFNRNVKIKIEVLGVDSRESFVSTKQKKIRKKTVSETTFNKNEYESLVNRRLVAIQQIKNKFLFNNRIAIDLNYSEQINNQILNNCPKCDIRILVTDYDPALK